MIKVARFTKSDDYDETSIEGLERVVVDSMDCLKKDFKDKPYVDLLVLFAIAQEQFGPRPIHPGFFSSYLAKYPGIPEKLKLGQASIKEHFEFLKERMLLNKRDSRYLMGLPVAKIISEDAEFYLQHLSIMEARGIALYSSGSYRAGRMEVKPPTIIRFESPR